MILAGTGHRPPKLGGYSPQVAARLRTFAREWLIDAAKTINLRELEVISGMALGWDTAWAQAAADLKIPFVVAIPFVGQESAWPPMAQYEYDRLLARASRQVVVSGGGYSVEKMQRHNKWMIDNCDYLVALWDGSPGGTANCVHYAQSIGRDVENLYPRWCATNAATPPA